MLQCNRGAWYQNMSILPALGMPDAQDRHRPHISRAIFTAGPAATSRQFPPTACARCMHDGSIGRSRASIVHDIPVLLVR
jgi:hypothetical protein